MPPRMNLGGGGGGSGSDDPVSTPSDPVDPTPDDPADEPRIDLGNDPSGGGGQRFSAGDDMTATQPDTPDMSGEVVVAPTPDTNDDSSVVHAGGETQEVNATVQETTDHIQNEIVGGGNDGGNSGGANVSAPDVPDITILTRESDGYTDMALGALVVAFLVVVSWGASKL